MLVVVFKSSFKPRPAPVSVIVKEVLQGRPHKNRYSKIENRSNIRHKLIPSNLLHRRLMNGDASAVVLSCKESSLHKYTKYIQFIHISMVKFFQKAYIKNVKST